MDLYIVKNLELGWDDIIAVFDASKYSLEEIKEVFNGKQEIIIDTSIRPLEYYRDF